MDRRDFLKSTGSAAAAVGAAASVAPAEAKAQSVHSSPGALDLVLALSAPDIGRGIAESGRRLAQRIETLTAGAVRIQIAADGSASVDADMWHGSANTKVAEQPAFSYFAGLPGQHGISAADLDAWIAVGGGQALWDDLGAQHGFKPLLAGHTGARPLLWSRASLSGRSSLQGLRFAGEGLTVDVARGLGAQPLVLAPGYLAQALAKDRADAVESAGAMHSLAEDIPTAAPFALTGGINRHGTAQSLSIKTAVWEALSESHRQAMAMASAEEFRLCVAEARVHERVARQVISQRHNVTIETPRLELSDAIARVSDAAVAHVAGSSRQAQRINASFMAFKSMLAPAGSGSALS